MAKESAKRAGNILVRFGKVSIGENVGSISIKINRKTLTLSKADELLCGRRLTGHLVEVRDDEDADQTNFLRGDRHRIKGSFDVKKYGVGMEAYSATLSFALNEIDTGELVLLANKTGRVLADHVFNLEAEDNNKGKAEADDDEDDDEGEGESSESVSLSMKGRKAARDGKAAAAK